jgi:superfamily I DNA/RNA helicase
MLGDAMRALLDVTPSAEQLSLFSRTNNGVEVIRGAAGSGKTTTALLKLRSSIGSFISRQKRNGTTTPVQILVLTYNRTLSGYISELASKQFSPDENIELQICTFAKWAVRTIGPQEIISSQQQSQFIRSIPTSLSLDSSFIEEEIEYLTGRFLPESLQDYLSVRREGRGGTPRVERPAREIILNEIIARYEAFKVANGLVDWNDIAVQMARVKHYNYDIVIVDETQDFSANQIRAIIKQLAPVHALTFVLDTAQRIYARGFTWQEVGITVRPENSFRLQKNYRSTKQIAALARSLVSGIGIDDDGTMPDYEQASRNGVKPIMLLGTYSAQVEFALKTVREKIDLEKESVAFLHPKGGGWFSFLRQQLDDQLIDYAEITREAEWPTGDENIALSTLHSSKGLEFDHVFILGLNAEILQHGEEIDDERLTMLRRLISMGIGRAKQSVILGYKPQTKAPIIDFFDKKTYTEVVV